MSTRRKYTRSRRTTTRRSTSASTSSTSRRRRSTTTKIISKTLSESFYRDVAAMVYERLGLDTLSISLDELVELLRPIVDAIVDQYSSRPSKEQVVNRMLRNADKLREAIAQHILETRDKLSEEQLEFVVYYGGPGIARHIQRLYKLALEYGREDLLDYLRGKWEELGFATPYECPRCRFRSVTPDLTCIVCGAVLSEEEFKRSIGFDELLEEFLESASPVDIEEVISTGRIVVDGSVLKPPSAPRSQYAVEVFLSRDELDKVKKSVEKRRVTVA